MTKYFSLFIIIVENQAKGRTEMAEKQKVILTNMCMIYDDEGRILVQNRLAKDWGGVTFPGGHVEKDESFYESVIREVKEETGLDIECPQICGIKNWHVKRDVRYIVLFYKTNRFSGEIRSSEEGEVFWIKPEELKNYKLASDFDEMYEIFANDELQEMQWIKENGEWVKRIF